jgi:hypothetical protein
MFIPHSLYHARHILTQINEGITKFFTLMVKGCLNKIMEFNYNICIILGYFHSP